MKLTPRHYALAMAGAGRGVQERVIAAAWHTERFARTKRLPNLRDELALLAEPAERQQSGNAAVVAQFQRLAARGMVTIN